MAKKRRSLGRGLSDISKLTPLDATKISKSDPQSVVQTDTSSPNPQSEETSQENKLSRVICITSGKGGTGKSIVTSNLACSFAKAGQKVAILDADMGLANIHLLLGVNPKYNITNIINGDLTAHEVVAATKFGFGIIPGGSGLTELVNLNDYQLDLLATAFMELENEANMLLIDTPAGIAPQTMRFLHTANEITVVTTPEITAVTDAYAAIKVTFRENPNAMISLVVNRTRSKVEANAVFKRLNTIVHKYLNKTIIDYGYILDDRAVNKSITARQPIILLDPTAKASRCIKAIAGKITNTGDAHKDRLNLTAGAFFNRLQENIMKATS